MYKRLNIPARAARSEDDLIGADRLVLPGVGAFDQAMNLLDASGMRPTLERLVTKEKKPIIGVCVGMQILTEGSDEGEREGLGWIPGRTRSFAESAGSAGLPLPHMGWNDVFPERGRELFRGLEDDSRFYFLHSYFVECAESSDCAATTEYGAQFACAVHRGNVWGVQFHPEKSHHWGAAVLKNFAEI